MTLTGITLAAIFEFLVDTCAVDTGVVFAVILFVFALGAFVTYNAAFRHFGLTDCKFRTAQQDAP